MSNVIHLTTGAFDQVAKINVDEEPQLAATFGVQQAPILVQALEAAGAR